VDLEEEEPKEKVNMDMVESGTSNVEVGVTREKLSMARVNHNRQK
jgi:hypothetical protein